MRFGTYCAVAALLVSGLGHAQETGATDEEEILETIQVIGQTSTVSAI